MVPFITQELCESRGPQMSGQKYAFVVDDNVDFNVIRCRADILRTTCNRHRNKVTFENRDTQDPIPTRDGTCIRIQDLLRQVSSPWDTVITW